MRKENLHVADSELLLYAERELGRDSGSKIGAHLARCSQCRARLKAMENALLEVSEANQENWKTQIPNGAGPRAALRLRLRLAELAAKEDERGWRSGWIALIGRRQVQILAGAAVVACLVLVLRLHGPVERSRPVMGALEPGDEPNLGLTPGATVPVSESELCGETATQNPALPISLKRQVFEEYGVTPPQPDAYEVDYLITPELGGATDIRNLWPEPYQNTIWNARVKDQLEDRLHRMVCHGDLDLTTAQRDISTDWIAAYRKYFHADRPVLENPSQNLSYQRDSVPRT